MAKRRRSPSNFTETSRDQAGFTGLHFDNLYDLDESVSGQRIDLATGEPIDNSSSDHLEQEMVGLHEVIENTEYKDELLQELLTDPEVVDLLQQFDKELLKAEQSSYVYRRRLRSIGGRAIDVDKK